MWGAYIAAYTILFKIELNSLGFSSRQGFYLILFDCKKGCVASAPATAISNTQSVTLKNPHKQNYLDSG
jgi:hypothetical protein